MADLIDSLVGYVRDIKPYHTKIFGVEVEYIVSEDINVTVDEEISMTVDVGLPVCEQLSSLAIAVGDDDGWDTKPYGELSWDIIQTELDGYCVPESRLGETIVFDGNVRPDHIQPSNPEFLLGTWTTYNKPTGLMDFVFTIMTEQLEITGQIVDVDVDDVYTVVNRPWDPLTTGIDTVEYGTNYIVVDTDLTSIFNINPNLQITIADSSFNDGTYTVLNAVFNSTTNETTITLNENTLDVTIPDGYIDLGFYDAFEWDGDSVTAIPQPDASINAKSTICESFTIVDGYGWDDGNVSWDDGTFDDAINIINDYSCSITGWEGRPYDDLPWDSDDTILPDDLTPTGVVVFSSEKMPVPNPQSVAYVHNQTVLDSVWVVDHNLGYYPMVRTYFGTQLLDPISVIHTNKQQVVITHSVPRTGEARLI